MKDIERQTDGVSETYRDREGDSETAIPRARQTHYKTDRLQYRQTARQ